jgi:hypothetical protein
MSPATERRLVVGASLAIGLLYLYACAWVDLLATL